MGQKRCYTGVWSNGKETIDLDYENSVIFMDEIKDTMYGSSSDSHSEIYVTPSGTIIERSEWSEIDDFFLDIGAITSRKHSHRIRGKNFKQIQEKGKVCEDYQNFMEWNDKKMSAKI